MINSKFRWVILLCALFFAQELMCQNNSENSFSNTPIISAQELLVDYNTWWSDYYYNINLSLDFVPIDEDANLISKKAFLEALTSGNYIPLTMKSDEGRKHYMLHRLGDDVVPHVSSTIKNVSVTRLKYYNMEGALFPEFDVIDIQGNILDNSSLDGKITVVKTWFIGCKPCVAEFPELNGLVREYERYTNIQFISLALDPTSNLERFLDRKPFLYKVVANQKVLIQDELGLNSYPTHIVLNEKRQIIKVVNKASELIYFLEKEIKL